MRPPRLFLLTLVFIAGLVGGCAGMYFKGAGPPPPAPDRTLDAWPYREYWQGIVFNGARIGFAHLTITPAPDAANQFDVHADAAFVLRLLGLEKKFTFKARDRVNADLSLAGFDYDFDLDGSHRRLHGRVRDGVLEAEVYTRGRDESKRLPVKGPVYPMNALSLYPVLHGLAVGREHRYTVFDGELLTLVEARQRVEAYETSELFAGPAFKLRTEVHGHTTRTWFNARGLPVFELALNGVLISALEDEHRARRYLAQASLNKQEVLLDFSRVPVDRPIPLPRTRRALDIAFTGLDAARLPPADAVQRCTAEGSEVRCRVRTALAAPNENPSRDANSARYLEPTLAVPSVAPGIRDTAAQIATGAAEDRERVTHLVEWIQKNIERKPVDVFSALDVLENRQAECQGHAYLFAAFARSLGIPTRVVNGLVYLEEANGFFYHTWNESLLGTAWLPVDPTFGQVGADATHVKLIEGETSLELAPLLDVIGRVQARVISYE